MPFCKKCGAELEKNVKFCPECGAPAKGTSQVKKKEDQSISDKTIRKSGERSYGYLNLEKLPIGHIIEKRYEIKEKLGQGGFGAVYRAYDRKMDIDKALKVIPEAVTNDVEAMIDLQDEARNLIKLNHPNIVRVYDFHDTGSIKYIDMEYIDGKTLTEIKLEGKGKKLPEDKVKELALQIADGMSYAHNSNILHKDIKPQNIKLNSKGKIKIMDFGIAETVHTSMSRIENKSSGYTIQYCSPEQYTGKDIGRESDIYSFGALLYDLLCGHPPFYKGNIEYQLFNVKPEEISHISSELNTILQKCLEKKYTKRYRTFEEITKVLGGKVKSYKGISKGDSSIVKRISKGKVTKLMTVNISTEPSGSSVWLDGVKLKQPTPLSIKHKAGVFSLKIDKHGYTPISEQIEIKEDESNDFYIELESMFGSITVETETSGHLVYLNGKDTHKKTPATLNDLMPGEYEIQIKSENYLFETKKVILKSHGKLNIQLPSVLGSITVESKEPGMRIFLNGKDIGEVTPFKIDNVLTGENKIYLEGDKYLSKERTVNLKPKDHVKIKPGLIEYSYLTVNSKYRDIAFNIDNKETKRSQEVKLKPGNYKLIPSIDYLPKIDINLDPGKRIELDYDSNIEKRMLTIHTGKYKIDVEVAHIETNGIYNYEIHDEKKLEVLPGLYKLSFIFRKKMKTKELNLKNENKKMDIEEILKARNKIIRNAIIGLSIILLYILFLFLIKLHYN